MIDDERLEEADYALRYFTDRFNEVRQFLNYLHDDPAKGTVLYYSGAGGNGKTLLLRFLRTYCCRRLQPAQWEALRGDMTQEPGPYMAAAVGAVAVPSAVLDFSVQLAGAYRPELLALLKLRQQLEEAQFHFPLFNCAFFIYLQKTGQLTEERLTQFFKGEELALLSAVADIVLDNKLIGLASAALDFVLSRTRQPVRDRIREEASRRLQSRGIDKALLDELRGLEAETTLFNRLPRYFAADLNAAMSAEKAPPRVVLFFDTHEALWGDDRDASSALYFGRDEWLRRLLLRLDLRHGIVVVVAGRERPRWSQAGVDPIKAQMIDEVLIGALSNAEANIFIDKVCAEHQELQPIFAAPLRQAIISYTSVLPNQVHPLFLAMAVDTVRLALAEGVQLSADNFDDAEDMEERRRRLIERMLKYAGDEIEHAVKALAAARSFDYEIFRRLGEALHFANTEPQFTRLIGFSFVYRPEGAAEGTFRIHELLRRIFREQNLAELSRADEALENLYLERSSAGDTTALLEVIYHASKRDPGRGLSEWAQAFERALQFSLYGLCDALLGLRTDMGLQSNFAIALMAQSAGDYLQTLARHSEAEQSYQQAIRSYDVALVRDPLSIILLNNKGNVLQRLGDLQATLAQHDAALDSYALAVAAYDNVLHRAPNDPDILNNKGNVLARLGDLQATLAQYPDALSSYTLAVAAFDNALHRAPDYMAIYNNKGNVLQRLGDLQATLAQHPAALNSYTLAVAAFDNALHRAPDLVQAYNNKGNVLKSLGDLQATLAQHDAALDSYALAVAAFDGALHRAPNDPDVLNNKGTVLHSLGDLQATLAQHPAALNSYTLAVAAFDDALHRAPDYVAAYNNKGTVLHGLGDLQATLAQHPAALNSYTLAVAAFDNALHRAPDYVAAYNNKGNVLHGLGDLQATLAQHPAALNSYTLAVAAFDNALHRAPDLVQAYNNKGNVLARLGDLQSILAQYPDALNSYTLAVAAYDDALHRAPDYVYAHNNKGNTLRRLGALELTLAQEAAQNEDNEGVADHGNRCCQSLAGAVAEYTRSLEIAPAQQNIRELLAQTQQALGQICSSGNDDDAAPNAPDDGGK